MSQKVSKSGVCRNVTKSPLLRGVRGYVIFYIIGNQQDNIPLNPLSRGEISYSRLSTHPQPLIPYASFFSFTGNLLTLSKDNVLSMEFSSLLGR